MLICLNRPPWTYLRRFRSNQGGDMPTFQLQSRQSYDNSETYLIIGAFISAKNIVRRALDTEEDPLDYKTGMTGTLVEVSMMDDRFDFIITVDVLVNDERLATAEQRIREIRDNLKDITGERDRVGVWLHLRGNGDLASQSFWCSIYDED